ncbi:transcriptional regulator [Spongiactinospora rosea]|uniref:Transcriptional regulator n=1 Tax=Spongiactinospora rosea TaxID=2248750 RepID=A0A366LP57_9ACTN|nr:helix-turn-helix domain-containing protein [Spongiactinospora rosea]RBQ15696.1 transcriptional regulator [Spongiactinospora rosea]
MRDRSVPAVPAAVALNLDEYAGRLRDWHEEAVSGHPRDPITQRDEPASPPAEADRNHDGPPGTSEGPPGTPDGPRRVIAASWRRSLSAGIDPERLCSYPGYETDDIGDARRAHPIGPHLPMLASTLLRTVYSTGMIMTVADADGRVLWRDGSNQALALGESVGLCDGFVWAESAVGTNGIGTALAAGRPVHVYPAEHLVKALQEWSCSGSPISDPDTGEIVGCVNVSGTPDHLHPATVALVHAAARLTESHLALDHRERDARLLAQHEGRARASRAAGQSALLSATGRVLAGELPGAARAADLATAHAAGHPIDRIAIPRTGDTVLLRDGTIGVIEPFGNGYLVYPTQRVPATTLTLCFLGADHPTAHLDGVPVHLSQRHAEILALLALNPGGMTADQLSFQLYGDLGKPVTIRAEMHRLRDQLGAAVAGKPYRLTCEVSADFVEVQRLLAGNDPTALAQAYRGPLLPRSESPALRRTRDELEGQVRARLLQHGSADALWLYAQTQYGRDDPHVLERLTILLPPGDHRAAVAHIRLSAEDS